MRRLSIPLVAAYLAVTTYLVLIQPRSLPAFLLFMASVLLLYYVKVPDWYRGLVLLVTLGVLMPYIGVR
ncbi:MAG: hypothetical protein ACRDIC_07475, partial [bacterium]